MDSICWRWWTQFVPHSGHDPWLSRLQTDDCLIERRNVFLSFADAVRNGRWHNGRRVSVSTVEKALQQTASILDRAGHVDPRRRTPGSSHLDKDFQDLDRRCRDEDPPRKFQLALPVSIFTWIVEHCCTSALLHVAATADLIILAFFFLLRVGECTKPEKRRPAGSGTRRQRTMPLRKCDVTLRRGDTVLPLDSPWSILQTADSATVGLDTQKNGWKGCNVLHTSTGTLSNPVQALARRIHGLQGRPPSTPLHTVVAADGTTSLVAAKQVRTMIRLAVNSSDLLSQGHDIARIGSHSVRASGALALHLAGHSHTVIKKIGRWSSRTCERHIHGQIDRVTVGVASTMAIPRAFRNTAFHAVG